jgi:hypothetical protein
MPSRGDPLAPTFNPTQPHQLRQYFNDLEYLFTLHHITNDQTMKYHTRRYLDIDCDDLLSYLPENSPQFSYGAFKIAIFRIFPGSEDNHWTFMDLENLVVDQALHAITSQEDFENYHNRFTTVSGYLEACDHISDIDSSRIFILGLQTSLWSRIESRLQDTLSEHNFNGSWPISDICDASKFIFTLHHTSLRFHPSHDFCDHSPSFTSLPGHSPSLGDFPEHNTVFNNFSDRSPPLGELPKNKNHLSDRSPSLDEYPNRLPQSNTLSDSPERFPLPDMFSEHFPASGNLPDQFASLGDISDRSTLSELMLVRSIPSNHIFDRSTPSNHISVRSTPSGHISDRSTPSNHILVRSTPPGDISDRSTLSEHMLVRSTPSNHISDRSAPSDHIWVHSTPSGHVSDRSTSSAMISDCFPSLDNISDQLPSLGNIYIYSPLPYPSTITPHLQAIGNLPRFIYIGPTRQPLDSGKDPPFRTSSHHPPFGKLYLHPSPLS